MPCKLVLAAHGGPHPWGPHTTHRLREKVLDPSLDEGEPEDGIDGGALTWVVLQAGVHQRAKVFGVLDGDSWIGPPVENNSQHQHVEQGVLR